MEVACHLVCHNPLAQLVADAAAVNTACLQRTPDVLLQQVRACIDDDVLISLYHLYCYYTTAAALAPCLRGIVAIAPEARTTRMIGSAAIMLAWVACGRLTAYWEPDLNAWDVAGTHMIQQPPNTACYLCCLFRQCASLLLMLLLVNQASLDSC
jgi:fructose-1,6-bisphosphatase/inositol monophosphatase family enzyme